MMEYRLCLPLQNKNFDENVLRFTINHIRSRRPSILYFIFHCYDMDCEKVVDEETGEISYTHEILVNDKPLFESPRGVIGTSYSYDPSSPDYTEKIELPSNKMEDIVYWMLEIRTLGIDGENPLYFSELMLNERDEFNGYHMPQEMDKANNHSIGLPNNLYANIYRSDGNYLQVIRPNKEGFNTNNLGKAKYTILAPHFEEEDEVDDHIAVFLECMNQTEQKIDVLR